MLEGEIKTCWNREPLEVLIDYGRNGYEVVLDCKHHKAVTFVPFKAFEAIAAFVEQRKQKAAEGWINE